MINKSGHQTSSQIAECYPVSCCTGLGAGFPGFALQSQDPSLVVGGAPTGSVPHRAGHTVLPLTDLTSAGDKTVCPRKRTEISQMWSRDLWLSPRPLQAVCKVRPISTIMLRYFPLMPSFSHKRIQTFLEATCVG